MDIITYFTLNTEHFVFAVALLCLLLGSFVNVVIARLPMMLERDWAEQARAFFDHADISKTDDAAASEAAAPEKGSSDQRLSHPHAPFNLAYPRSQCPQCGQQIAWFDNLPVLSFLLLRGRCRGCRQRISLRYPLIELICGVLGGFIASQFGVSLDTLALVSFTLVLVSLTFIDVDHYLLPDQLTLGLLWLGLAYSLISPFTSPQSAILGAIFGYASLFSIYYLFKLLTGKEGMGFGDFKLLAALGAWCGYQQLLIVILLSSAVGAVLGVLAIMLMKRDHNQPIPFGPYLAVAGWITLLYGDAITHWYLSNLL